MKLKTKILTDKFIGLPIVYVLNILARLLGFFLRIDHSLNKPIKRIAICKFVGMGSVIQSTPLLKTLRKKFPDAEIIFITNTSNLTLFKYIDDVNSVFCITDKNIATLILSNVKLLFKLWKRKPDIYIDLEIYSNYSSIIATMSLAKNRFGFFKDDKTYRKGMYTHMMFFNIKSPISQTYLQFARLLGCIDVYSEVIINASKKDSSLIKMIAEILNIDLTKKYILINPNASDLRLERRWSTKNFIDLTNMLASVYPDFNFIFIGGNNEMQYVGEIKKSISNNTTVFDSSGKLNLDELISLIANAQLLITNDTGPMHLAFALNTKTVSLFGPCSPQQYGGAKNTISIYKNVYCSPCVHDFIIPPCKGNNECMKRIKTSEVLEAVSKALNNQFINNSTSSIEYLSSNENTLGLVLR